MTEKQSIISGTTVEPTGESLNLEATELRLGPPGSDSPSSVAGAKRGFSDVSKWVDAAGSPRLGGKSLNGSDVSTGSASSMAMERKGHAHNSSSAAANDASNSKAQVVGWPPIRSFRKNSMATNPPKSNTAKADLKPDAGCVYVKVSMDGAPYLRKVDLTTYSSYAQLSAALENMFSCFTIGMTHLGQYGYNGFPGRDGLSLSGSRLKDLPHTSEQCILTYEDKDGDWMLVGDVPWDMFTNTCRRVRITKSSEAIGLAPRAMEKRKDDE